MATGAKRGFCLPLSQPEEMLLLGPWKGKIAAVHMLETWTFCEF